MNPKFKLYDEINKPNDIVKILNKAVKYNQFVKNNKGEQFLNVPVSFDIEVTSFYTDGKNNYTYDECEEDIKYNKHTDLKKHAIMYVWQFGINGHVIIGRTWEEFKTMLSTIETYLNLNEKRRIIIYVHNLSYEFQFIRKWFEWNKVFAIDERKPIYAISNGFEFRCSYLLSGYSLNKLSDQLNKYKVTKLVGDLDYSKLRHSKTKLTKNELAYCKNDVLVVMAYIQEKMEDSRDNISLLPLTKTGFVRSYCRKKCLYVKNEKGRKIYNTQYKNLMKNLTIEADEFLMLQRAFQGGFTHANANYVRQICKNVTSFDFTSSYPYVMCSSYFPMGKGVKVDCTKINESDFLRYINKFCCLFNVVFYGIRSKIKTETPISASRCFYKDGVILNNGRVVSANMIATTITELDFKIYLEFYEWDSIVINDLWIYKRDYLPKELITTILEFYEDKTKLKGVEGKEIEYLKAKENINSCYGMAVTSPIRTNFIYNGVNWVKEDPELVESIIKYNNSESRFLFYPWGVWVTAHARYNLFTGIYNVGNDYIYSDTDSIKIFNANNHKKYFDAYNKLVYEKLSAVCKRYNIDIEKTQPKTIDGIMKPLGVWDFDGEYKKFKTLGAKRYMVLSESHGYSLTVSGLNKTTAVPYMLEHYGENDIFNQFDDMLTIPAKHTGKNIHTYIDDRQIGFLVDYNGVSYSYEELSSVHLSPCEYALSMPDRFLDYLKGLKYE